MLWIQLCLKPEWPFGFRASLNPVRVGFCVACNRKTLMQGRLGGSVASVSDFGSGRDLTVRGFEPRIGLCADSSACFGFCVSLSLCPSPILSLSLSLSLSKNKAKQTKNKQTQKHNREINVKKTPKVICGVLIVWGVSTLNPHVVQGLTVHKISNVK